MISDRRNHIYSVFCNTFILMKQICFAIKFILKFITQFFYYTIKFCNWHWVLNEDITPKSFISSYRINNFALIFIKK